MIIKDNQYYIGPHRVDELCCRFGTPLYVYDAEIIRARIYDVKTEAGVYPKTEFLYAVKANYNPFLIHHIVKKGLGVDAVSPEEVRLGLLCGAKPEQILFTENNATDAQIDEVFDLGVLINVGSLSHLGRFGRAHPGSRVCVRFNPNIGIASHESNITGGADSKFGISFQDVDRVKGLIDQYQLRLVGIHQHIGSGWLRLREPILALDVILDIAKQCDGLEFIDVGGGFGVPYRPKEHRLDMKTLGRQIAKRMEQFCASYGSDVALRFEPGRYIIAEAGHLLTTVSGMKQSISRRTIVGTDTGMHHLVRTAMYGSYHEIVNITNPDGMHQEYDVTGNICECADFFAKNRMLPEVREGDILSIETAGAYGMAMASNYQFRPLPAEVLVDEDRVTEIRPRQTFGTLLAQFGHVSFS